MDSTSGVLFLNMNGLTQKAFGQQLFRIHSAFVESLWNFGSLFWEEMAKNFENFKGEKEKSILFMNAKEEKHLKEPRTQRIETKEILAECFEGSLEKVPDPAFCLIGLDLKREKEEEAPKTEKGEKSQGDNERTQRETSRAKNTQEVLRQSSLSPQIPHPRSSSKQDLLRNILKVSPSPKEAPSAVKLGVSSPVSNGKVSEDIQRKKNSQTCLNGNSKLPLLIISQGLQNEQLKREKMLGSQRPSARIKKDHLAMDSGGRAPLTSHLTRIFPVSRFIPISQGQ